MKSLPTRFLIVTLLVVSVTACTARYLRQAQDEFNRGAQMENAAFVRGYDIDVSDLTEDPAAAYRISLSLVNRELDKNESALRQDKLYGTALMLKAMCLWRLTGDLSSHRTRLERAIKAFEDASSEEDRTRAEEALSLAQQEWDTAEGELTAVIKVINIESKAGQIVLGERDRAMLNALPGLRDHDLALQARTYEDAERFFKSALNVMGATTKDQNLVSPGSQMAIYLRLAMLSTCRAWHYAAFSFNVGDLNLAKEKAADPRKRAEKLFKELESLAKGNKRLDKAIKRMKIQMLGPL